MTRVHAVTDDVLWRRATLTSARDPGLSSPWCEATVLRTVTYMRPSGLTIRDRVAAGALSGESVVRIAPDPLLHACKPNDLALFFTTFVPADTLVIPFRLTHHRQKYSILFSSRRRVYIVDSCTANFANHARPSHATCEIRWLQIAIAGSQTPLQLLCLQTVRDVGPGWRVTFTYRHPPVRRACRSRHSRRGVQRSPDGAHCKSGPGIPVALAWLDGVAIVLRRRRARVDWRWHRVGRGLRTS